MYNNNSAPFNSNFENQVTYMTIFLLNKQQKIKDLMNNFRSKNIVFHRIIIDESISRACSPNLNLSMTSKRKKD